MKRGTTVTWVNKDGDAHTVTAVGTKPLFGSNPLDTGDSFSFTFNEPGTYSYFCKIHPTHERRGGRPIIIVTGWVISLT